MALACAGAELGHLTGMLAHITPAVNAVADPRDPGERTSANAAFVQAVVEKNVEHAVAAMRERSSILRDLESSGAIRIAGAVYDVHSGRVDFGT